MADSTATTRTVALRKKPQLDVAVLLIHHTRPGDPAMCVIRRNHTEPTHRRRGPFITRGGRTGGGEHVNALPLGGPPLYRQASTLTLTLKRAGASVSSTTKTALLALRRSARLQAFRVQLRSFRERCERQAHDCPALP